jgi:hypothetical protein
MLLGCVMAREVCRIILQEWNLLEWMHQDEVLLEWWEARKHTYDGLSCHSNDNHIWRH